MSPVAVHGHQDGGEVGHQQHLLVVQGLPVKVGARGDAVAAADKLENNSIRFIKIR